MRYDYNDHSQILQETQFRNTLISVFILMLLWYIPNYTHEIHNVDSTLFHVFVSLNSCILYLSSIQHTFYNIKTLFFPKKLKMQF